MELTCWISIKILEAQPQLLLCLTNKGKHPKSHLASGVSEHSHSNTGYTLLVCHTYIVYPDGIHAHTVVYKSETTIIDA